MVVTRSRLHAVRMHEAIQEYISRKGYDSGPRGMRALVAFSGTVKDPDAVELEYTEPGINGFPEGQLPKRFREDAANRLLVAASPVASPAERPAPSPSRMGDTPSPIHW